MAMSLGSIWAPGAGSVALLSPVLGALVLGPMYFVMDAPSDDLFLSDGQFVGGNAVVGAVVGAFLGLLLLIPAGVVWTGLFAWVMVRQVRRGWPVRLSIRWQAVLIASAVQLVALAQFVWAMRVPTYGDPEILKIPGTLLVAGVVLLMLIVGVAALLGPWLVQRAERRAAPG
ncbi:MAG: hypothetical protein ABI720_10120 [Actinomycetes bacterium]